MPNDDEVSSYDEERNALETALETEGFRRFREMGPLYHRIDPLGSTFRRPTRPMLLRRDTPLAAISARPQVRRVEPIQDPGLKAKYLGLIITHRPLTVGDLPSTTPRIPMQAATL